MAKTKNDIKLLSTEGTGTFYVTKKNPKNTTKLELRKYDPRLRQHVIFKEAKIKEGKKK
ncbi:MAG: 50S ribosomal protein L33 [Bdellovibrionales bacterium]